ncbi:MAG: hypothetical protein ACR2GQ_09555 [Gemmatimonadota bacterium]
MDVLAALCLLALGAVAATGMVFAGSRSARLAAFEGRRASAAIRAADRVRGGLAPGDSGSFVVVVAGDSFTAEYVRPGAAAPGGVRVTVHPPDGGASLVFEPATPVP